MPLSYGGGITTLEQVKRLLAIGYEKVVINTALVENPQLVKEAVEFAGGQSVVASIDAKKDFQGYCCVIRDGRENIKIEPAELAKRAEKYGVGEILINSVDRDGMMDGYDISLVKSIVENVSVSVTACGGAGGIEDLKRVIEQGKAHAAAAGSMFVYYGKLKAVLITAPSEEELMEAGIYR